MAVLAATKKTIKDYSEASSIHGIIYIFDYDQPLVFRLLWFAVVLIFLILAYVSSYQAFVDWRANPVVTSLDSVSVPVNEVEFPAVTLCPKGGKYQSALETLIYQVKKLKQHEGKMVDFRIRKEDLVDMVNYIDLDMLSYLQRLYPEFINSTTHKSAHVSYLQMVSVLYGLQNPSSLPTTSILTQLKSELGLYDECNLDAVGLRNVSDSCPNDAKVVPFDMYAFAKGDCVYISEEVTKDKDICTELGGYALKNDEKNIVMDFMNSILSTKDEKIIMSYFWMDTYYHARHFEAAFYGPVTHLLNSTELFVEEPGSNLTSLFHDLGGTYSNNYAKLNLVAKINLQTKEFEYHVAGLYETARYICHFPMPKCQNYTYEDEQYSREQHDIYIKSSPWEFFYHPTRLKEREVKKKLILEVQKIVVNKLLGNEESKENLIELLWLSMTPCFDSEHSLMETSAQSQATILECIWKGKRLPCNQIFSPVATDKGVCCSFNLNKTEEIFKAEIDTTQRMKRLQEQSLQHSYSTDTKAEMDPNWRQGGHEPIAEEGIGNGLTLLVDTISNLLSESSLEDDFDGLLTLVDTPSQYPQMEKRGFLIESGHETYVTISATQIDAEEDIREYAPEDRGCYFEDEVTLKGHKLYTKSNCQRECIIEKTMQYMIKSGTTPCLPWHFPALENDTAICDPWQAEIFYKTFQEEEIKPNPCPHCLDDCTETFYNTEQSSTPFGECDKNNLGLSHLCSLPPIKSPVKYLQNVIDEYGGDVGHGVLSHDFQGPMADSMAYTLDKAQRDWKPLLLHDVTSDKDEVFPRSEDHTKRYDSYEKDLLRVHFSFGSTRATRFKRQVAMSNVGFISQVGGLVGLFMGFSFSSGVEILFWVLVKWNIIRREMAAQKQE